MNARIATTSLFSALTLVLLAPPPAAACTTFFVEGADGVAVGKSYDWRDGLGMVLLNKRGVAKQALPAGPNDPPARWVSKYASLTFNQYGREMPNGGMNEKGLVVEIMWLNAARYPASDARPTLNELQWIQYQLDTHATVAEVVEAAPEMRVANTYAKVHYMACDPGGACVAVEYLDGKLVLTAPSAMTARVLTNHTYAESLAQARRDGADAPSGTGSLARFSRAAAATRAAVKDARATAFAVLDSVSQGDYSKWNIVYEPKARAVHFRTFEKTAVKTIHLDRLDGSCKTPVKMLDLATELSGDVTEKLGDYSVAANEAQLTKSYAKLRIPAAVAAEVARYPSALRCTQ